MELDLKRTLTFGTTALAAVAFAGGAYAATQDSGPSARQAFLSDVAKRLKVSPKDLTSALQGAVVDQLQAAVKAGRLTQAQANQIERRIRERGVAPNFFGLRGPGGLAAPEPPGAGPGGGLAGAARYLGLNAQQLRDQLAAGRSLAQIAKARGKSGPGLENAITTAVRTSLDRAAAGKLITPSQEAQALSRLAARLRALVNGTGAGPRFGPGGPLGHTGRMGLGVAPPAPPPPPAY